MAEWALYLDESGDTRPHVVPLREGQMPVFTLSGVALPLNMWREYDRRFLSLKRAFFENEIERSSKVASTWEFKGNRAIAPRNKDSERNRTFAYRTLDLIRECYGKIFGVTFLKSATSPAASVSIYTHALQVLAERFGIFLREAGVKGIIIIDSRMAHVKQKQGIDYQVAHSYLSYIFGHKDGRQLKRLIEGPLFADSGLTAGLQIADLVAALVYGSVYAQRLCSQPDFAELGYLDYGHTTRFRKPLEELQFTSKRKYKGYFCNGLRTIDHRHKPGQRRRAKAGGA